MITLDDIEKQGYIGQWVIEQTEPKLSEFIDTLKAMYSSPLEFDFTPDHAIEIMESCKGKSYSHFRSIAYSV